MTPQRNAADLGVVAMLAMAWANLRHAPSRSLSAVFGLALAILLAFIQLGFLSAARMASTRLIDMFDFDLAIVSDQFHLVGNGNNFQTIRMVQASMDPAVVDMVRLIIEGAMWTDPKTENTSFVTVIGIDDKPWMIEDQQLAKALPSLREYNTVLMDRHSHEMFGSRQIGQTAKIFNRDVTVSGLLDLGLFFHSLGSIVVTSETLFVNAGVESNKATVGMIKLEPKSNLIQVRDRIKANLPNDVLVLTRQQLVDDQQNYFVTVKPVGIMMRTGGMVALLAEAVILFQVFSSDLRRKFSEYATLLAIGFPPWFVAGVCLGQAQILAVLGSALALGLAWGLFLIAHIATGLPTNLTWITVAEVLGLSVLVVAIASLFALFKLSKLNPADVFKS